MTLHIPAEWEPHVCCWMAWAVHVEWKDWIDKVKYELEGVIREISRFEPVRLLTPPDQVDDARARFSGGNIQIIEAPVDDIWMRDIAPIFALRDGEVIAIDLNFNGWGNTRPSRPGDRLAKTASTIFGVPGISAPFIAEGGALITDGEGTAVTTESCLLNPNRNPFGREDIRKPKIEQALEDFGVRHIIWLKGDTSELITSGHIDGYGMFTAPGVLLIEAVEDDDARQPYWRGHDIAVLENSRDAVGRRLKVERVLAPRKRHWRYHGRHWAPCYLNAYVANGAVITGRFGDHQRDEAANDALMRAFPDRIVLMLCIDYIASGGGGIRCLTQPMMEPVLHKE